MISAITIAMRKLGGYLAQRIESYMERNNIVWVDSDKDGDAIDSDITTNVDQ